MVDRYLCQGLVKSWEDCHIYDQVTVHSTLNLISENIYPSDSFLIRDFCGFVDSQWVSESSQIHEGSSMVLSRFLSKTHKGNTQFRYIIRLHHSLKMRLELRGISAPQLELVSSWTASVSAIRCTLNLIFLKLETTVLHLYMLYWTEFMVSVQTEIFVLVHNYRSISINKWLSYTDVSHHDIYVSSTQHQSDRDCFEDKYSPKLLKLIIFRHRKLKSEWKFILSTHWEIAEKSILSNDQAEDSILRCSGYAKIIILMTAMLKRHLMGYLTILKKHALQPFITVFILIRVWKEDRFHSSKSMKRWLLRTIPPGPNSSIWLTTSSTTAWKPIFGSRWWAHFRRPSCRLISLLNRHVEHIELSKPIKNDHVYTAKLTNIQAKANLPTTQNFNLSIYYLKTVRMSL